MYFTLPHPFSAGQGKLRFVKRVSSVSRCYIDMRMCMFALSQAGCAPDIIVLCGRASRFGRATIIPDRARCVYRAPHIMYDIYAVC